MHKLLFISVLSLLGIAVRVHDEGVVEEEKKNKNLADDEITTNQQKTSVLAAGKSESEDDTADRAELNTRVRNTHELTAHARLPDAVVDGLKEQASWASEKLVDQIPYYGYTQQKDPLGVAAHWANGKIGGKIPLLGHVQQLEAKQQEVLERVYREIDPHFNALYTMCTKTLSMVVFGLMQTIISYGGWACTGHRGNEYDDVHEPLFKAARFFSTAQLGFQDGFDRMIPNPQAETGWLWSQLNGHVDVVAEILSAPCLGPLDKTIETRRSYNGYEYNRFMLEQTINAAMQLGGSLQKYVDNKNFRSMCMEVTSSVSIPRAPPCQTDSPIMLGRKWNLISRNKYGQHQETIGTGNGDWNVEAFRQPWMWTQWVLDVKLDIPDAWWIQKQWHVKCINGRATSISINNGGSWHEWSGFGSYYSLPTKEAVKDADWNSMAVMQTYLLMSEYSEKVHGRFR